MLSPPQLSKGVGVGAWVILLALVGMWLLVLGPPHVEGVDVGASMELSGVGKNVAVGTVLVVAVGGVVFGDRVGMVGIECVGVVGEECAVAVEGGGVWALRKQHRR